MNSIPTVPHSTEPHKGHTSFLFYCHFYCHFLSSMNVSQACLMASIIRKCVIRAVRSALVTPRSFLQLLAPHHGQFFRITATRGNALSRNEVRESYFNVGFTAQEIVLFLANVRCMYISVRYLERILRRLGCKRRRF